MWRFIGVLSLLLLPYAVSGAWNPLPPCPEDQVCAIFMEDKCANAYVGNNDPEMPNPPDVIGLLWNEITKCGNPPKHDFDSQQLWGRIDIKVINAYTWTIVTTIYDTITGVRFEFKDSDMTDMPKLTFSGTDKDATAIFTWEGKRKEFKMEHLRMEDSKHVNQFTLDLTDHGVKIADITEEHIRFVTPTRNYGDVNAYHGFGDKLRELTPCDVSDLHEADPCVGDCNSLTKLNLTGLIRTERFCPKTLWYHNKDEDPESKNWAKVDGIKCNISYWELDKGEGASERVSDSLEFQCSEFTPTHPFPMGAKIGLAVAGGIGLLVLMGIAGFFIWRHFERKDAKTASAMGIVTGFRPQDLPKGYLDKPKSTRNDLVIGSAKTPGDEGTNRDTQKDAGTPGSPADTPTPDSKV